MSAKTIVKQFYDLDLAKENEALSLFHTDCELHWNSSQGYTFMNYDGIKEQLEGVRNSFHSFRYKLSHFLADENTVTARYTIYITTIENPDEEEALAHFISIWEVKDDKLFRGFEISQHANDHPKNKLAFSEIKI